MAKTVFMGFAMLLALTACQDKMDNDISLADMKAVGQTVVHDTFMASFEEASTRTQLEGKSVVWTKGDKIRVYGSTADGDYQSGTFITQQAGSNVTFSGNNIETQDYYYAIYPDERITSQSTFTNWQGNDCFEVAMEIPSVQTAVPDGIANQLNLAFAKTDASGNTLFFHNLCALIKFELAGTGVSQLKRVRLRANNNAYGMEICLSGKAWITLDGERIDHTEGNPYVELTGDFDESHTYYILIAPEEMSKGFILTLINDEGKEYILEGTNEVFLNPSEMLNLGTIQVESDDFSNGIGFQYTANNSPHPVSWVVISEGFTKDQMDEYHTYATEMLDFIFEVEPFKQYKSHFNIHVLDVASQDEGADITDRYIDKNTFFDAGWAQYSFSNMNANSQKLFSFVEAHNPDILSGKVNVNETGIIMLINDNRYGGICYNWSDGKAFAMVPISYKDEDGKLLKWAGNGGSKSTSEGTWMNTALHEGGGHMFGKLADEYIGKSKYSQSSIARHSWTVPFGLNLTADIENNLLWKDLIPDEDGVKQEGKYLHVGTYEGGMAYYNEGIWRSEQVSCMDDNRPYFSAWQRYLIAKRIYDLAQEPFTYDDFIANDSQYISIQEGVEFAGTEGFITTFFSPTGIRYNASQAPLSLRKSGSDDIMPPLPPPVLIEE